MKFYPLRECKQQNMKNWLISRELNQRPDCYSVAVIASFFFSPSGSDDDPPVVSTLLSSASASFFFCANRGCSARGTYPFGFSPFFCALFLSCFIMTCTESSTVSRVFRDAPQPILIFVYFRREHSLSKCEKESMVE